MTETPFADLMTLESVEDDRFIAPRAPETGGTMFGGQFLAQGLMAANATVSDRQANSLHAYFLRPGAIDAPTEITVERIRDGRSFSSRGVTAWQSGKQLFRMMVSYQIEEPGRDYSGASMPDVPPPEEVKHTYAEVYGYFSEGRQFVEQRESYRPWDILYVNPPLGKLGVAVTEDQRMWMRIRESLADRRDLWQAALVYLSDSTLIDHVVLPHGLRWELSDVDGTSLDHAMWFQRSVRPDQWLLFDQSVESTGGARGLARGRFFTADRQHVSTCCQEGLMRISE